MKIKWSTLAIEAYKAMGTEMRAQGAHPIREISDPDVGTVLTMWAVGRGVVITQTWTDTGDVVYYRSVSSAVEASRE